MKVVNDDEKLVNFPSKQNCGQKRRGGSHTDTDAYLVLEFLQEALKEITSVPISFNCLESLIIFKY